MHYYIDNKRFTEEHPAWPKTKAGTPRKRPTLEMIEDAGGCLGVTDTIKLVENSGWMMKYFGELGIDAGLKSNDFEEAQSLFEKMSTEAAERGTAFHDAIERYLRDGDDPDNDKHMTACRAVADLVNSWGIPPDERCFEHCMTHEMYTYEGVFIKYGGTIDLCTDGIIADWKTVNKPRKPYRKELLQLCAYSCGDLDKRLLNVYIHADTGEIIDVYEWTQKQKESGWRLFQDVAVLNRRLRDLDRSI